MSRNILIVNDDVSLLSTLLHACRTAEFEAVGTPDSSEAIDLAWLYQPHIVLFDLLMAGISGHEFMGELSRRRVRSQVIMTGPAEMEPAALDRLGAAAYLRTPPSVPHLLAELNRLCHLPRRWDPATQLAIA